MKCKKITKWIPLFITGDLEPQEKISVEGHLRECSRCQEMEQKYRKDRQRILHLKELDLSPKVFEDYWEEIQGRLQNQLNEDGAHKGKILLLNWGTRLALAASFLLAITLWGGKLWEKEQPPLSPPTHSPSPSVPSQPVFRANSSSFSAPGGRFKFFSPPLSPRGRRTPFFIPSRLPGAKHFRFEIKRGKIKLFLSPKKRQVHKQQEQNQDGKKQDDRPQDEMEF